MPWFPGLVLFLVTVPLTDSSPPSIPLTCYSKVLSLAREVAQRAAYFKNHYETSQCMAHMPDLCLDVHNACVMYRMRAYISLLERVRDKLCSHTPDVHRLGHTLRHTLRQLFIIMSQKCHGIQKDKFSNAKRRNIPGNANVSMETSR